MKIIWGGFSQKNRGRLKAGWLITAGVIALYLGAIQPITTSREISAERATGVDATEWQPISMWRSIRPFTLSRDRAEGVVGGVPGGFAGKQVSLQKASLSSLNALPSPPNPDDRKMIRNAAMDLVVKNPRDASEKIRQFAEHDGGFVVSAETNGGQENSSASLTIRVPRDKFEEARAEIRKLGVREESERLEAKDVTKEYVDESARLRNLRAQETQYLGILRHAKTVKETLEVSDKLNEVRGEIEQQQAEFDALSKQVETVALMISLRSEAEAQVFGLNWRPLYQLKLAARQGIEGVGDYAAAMAAFLFYLPTVLLWLGTILIGAAVGWRILRWAGRALFVPRVKTAHI